MTDLEISKALALAIGYLPEHISQYGVGSVNFNQCQGVAQVFRHDGIYGVERTDCRHLWNNFDYRDWNVIGPIAERFFCFPSQYVNNDGKVIAWEAGCYSEKRGMRSCIVKEDTPQKAIALAVIEGAKK